MKLALLMLQLLSLPLAESPVPISSGSHQTVTVLQLKVYMHAWRQEDGTFYYPDSSMQLVGTVSFLNEKSKGTTVHKVNYKQPDVPVTLLLTDPLQFEVSDNSCELALLSVWPPEQSPGIKAATILAKFPFRFTDPLFAKHPANIIFRNDDTVMEMDLKWD